MGGKVTDSNGVRIWVGWSCLASVREMGEEGTGVLGCAGVEGRVG